MDEAQIVDIESGLTFRDAPNGMRMLESDGRYEVANFQLGTNKTKARGTTTIEAVVLHCTASKATRKPASALARFQSVLLPKDTETVSALVGRLDAIPSGLVLSLQNAKSSRKGGWDILIGDDGLIVQGNMLITQRFTEHAGRSRKRYIDKAKRDIFYTDPWTMQRHLVWDRSARQFRYPLFPNGRVPPSINIRTIGIEIENYGPVILKRGRYYSRGASGLIDTKLRSDQVMSVNGKYYERIGDATWRSLIAVCAAIRDAFQIPEGGWFGHEQFTPDQRAEPQPPLHIAKLVAQLYPVADDELMAIDPDAIDGEPGEDDEDDEES